MKQLFIIAGLALTMSACLISCGSPEKRAQKLIKKYVTEIEQSKNYDVIEFGSLDTLLTSFWTSETASLIIKTANENKEQIESSLKLARKLLENGETEKAKILADEIQALSDATGNLMMSGYEASQNFVPEFDGWKMEFRWKINNEIKYAVFYFDKKITKITDFDYLD